MSPRVQLMFYLELKILASQQPELQVWGGCGQDWAPGKLDLMGTVAGYKSLWKPFTHLFDFQV